MSFSPPPSAVDTAVDALASYLETNVQNIGINNLNLTMLTEWPQANQALKYPCATLTTGIAKRTPLANPEQIAVTAPDDNHMVTQTLSVAHYDIPVQLDLWTRSRAERRLILDAILYFFNKDQIVNEGPPQLSIQLTDYFNICARYVIDTHEFRDDEQAAQRQERRCRIALLVNTEEAIQKQTYAITQGITVEQGVSSANSELTDDTEDTETQNIG